jgi:hypothetical protein
MRRVLAGAAALLAACLLASGCRTIPDPEIPPQEKASSAQEASALLREYQLTKVGHLYGGAYFLQGEKEYHYPYQRISGLFQYSSDEARGEYRRGSNQALLAGIAGGVSGSLIGYPLGWYWYRGNGQWSTMDNVLIGSGLVAGVVGVIFSLIADGSFEEAVIDYNKHLRATFGAE